MGLVYILGTPYILYVVSFNMNVVKAVEKEYEHAYLKGGSNAEQALNSIKIVKAFGNESFEVNKFSTHLKMTQSDLESISWKYGFSWAFKNSIMFVFRIY